MEGLVRQEHHEDHGDHDVIVACITQGIITEVVTGAVFIVIAICVTIAWIKRPWEL